MSDNWTVKKDELSWVGVENFFRKFSKAPTPEPHDFDTVYSVTIDSELVGVAVVCTFSRPHLYGVGVLPEYREQGIGSALVERCIEEHENLYCRVRKDNKRSIALCESVGLEQCESMWPDEIWNYES